MLIFFYFFIFFYVGPPKEDIFLGHLLCPIFQSTLHITFTSLCLGVDTVRFSFISINANVKYVKDTIIGTLQLFK